MTDCKCVDENIMQISEEYAKLITDAMDKNPFIEGLFSLYTDKYPDSCLVEFIAFVAVCEAKARRETNNCNQNFKKKKTIKELKDLKEKLIALHKK
jgi:hypothetical protein